LSTPAAIAEDDAAEGALSVATQAAAARTESLMVSSLGVLRSQPDVLD